MSNVSGTTNQPTRVVDSVGDQMSTGTDEAAAPAGTLPSPPSPPVAEDLMTALAMLTIQQHHDQRMAADQQRSVAAKAQEEAQAEKISKMRELADDTFYEGLTEGILGGAAAAASAASACTSFSASTKGPEQAGEAAKLTRNAKLLDATSTAFSASSKLGGAIGKAEQEQDRVDMALADGAVDRAKSAAEAASAESRKAEEDIRETINAIRQYVAAKSQLANAAIMKA